MNISALNTANNQYQAKQLSKQALDAPTTPLSPSIELLSGQDLIHAKQALVDDLNTLFEQSGIRHIPVPTLTSDSQGNIHVSTSHPDKEKIEALFRNTPYLQQRFAKISAGESLQRALDNKDNIAHQLENIKSNRTAQQALINQLSSENKAPFYLTIYPDHSKSFFGINQNV